MAWNASFGVFEPSESVLRALQAKVGRQTNDAYTDSYEPPATGAQLRQGIGANRVAAGAFSLVPPVPEEVVPEESASVPMSRKQRGVAPHLLPGRPPPQPDHDQDSPTRNSEHRRPRPQPTMSLNPSPFKVANAPREPRPRPPMAVAGSGATPSSSSSAAPRAASLGVVPEQRQAARAGYGPTPSHYAGYGGAGTPSGAAHFTAEPGEMLRPPRLPMGPSAASAEECRSGVANAADAALASALAHLSIEGEVRASVEPPRQDMEIESFPVQQVDFACQHIPSVVTFGGQPVACDGDLIYLGGGLYASAQPAPQPQAARKGARVMPGRVGPGPRAGVGRGARSRSASARGLPSPSHYGDELGVNPPLSRAHSDGGPSMPLWKEEKKKPDGPAPWCPSGAGFKLQQPPPHIKRSRSHASDQMPYQPDVLLDGGGHSEARYRERENTKRDELGLFGPGGLLGQITKMQEMPCGAPRAPVVGAPSNSTDRAEERRLAKEDRVNEILNEQAELRATEAQAAHGKGLRRTPGASSAPSLGLLPHSTPRATPRPGPSEADLEKQKLRVACKMEMLDFFKGYANNVSNMSVEQTKAILAQLHGGLVNADKVYGPASTTGLQCAPSASTPSHRARGTHPPTPKRAVAKPSMQDMDDMLAEMQPSQAAGTPLGEASSAPAPERYLILGEEGKEAPAEPWPQPDASQDVAPEESYWAGQSQQKPLETTAEALLALGGTIADASQSASLPAPVVRTRREEAPEESHFAPNNSRVPWPTIASVEVLPHEASGLIPNEGDSTSVLMEALVGAEEWPHEGDAAKEWPDEGDASKEWSDYSVQGRLQHVNDVCNKAFDIDGIEDEGF